VCVRNVAVIVGKENVYMELVGKCVCGECGSYWGEGKCIYWDSG